MHLSFIHSFIKFICCLYFFFSIWSWVNIYLMNEPISGYNDVYYTAYSHVEYVDQITIHDKMADSFVVFFFHFKMRLLKLLNRKKLWLDDHSNYKCICLFIRCVLWLQGCEHDIIVVVMCQASFWSLDVDIS